MAFDSLIPDGFPNQYADQWRIQFQQRSSRLTPYVNIETIRAEGKRFQRLPKVTSRAITERFGDTNPDDIEAEYRWMYPTFRHVPHRLDRRDGILLGSVGSPHSQILQLQLAEAMRDMDRTLINGIRGTVQSGKTGGTPITFDSECDTVAVNFVDSGSPANSGMTFSKALEVATRFGLANVSGQDEENQAMGCLVITHRQLKDLLREEKLTSSDYGLHRLNEGKVVSLFGMAVKVVSAELLPHNAGTDVRTCYAFAREAVAFGVAENPTAFVDVLPTKMHDIQLRTEWGFACTRLDGDGVQAILCDESP